MVGEDRVVMSGSELRRVHVIRQVIEHQLTQQKASEALGLTVRHIRRLSHRLRADGDGGLAHRSRGKPSNRRKPAAFKQQVLALYARHYSDFGPTLAVEQLAKHHGLTLSDETLRRWLRAQGIEHFTRRRRPHRTWRARRAHRGELVQLDGSHHDWFEGRGPRCVLMAYIDDASSRVFARFYEYEGTWSALDSFQRYVKQYGIPLDRVRRQTYDLSLPGRTDRRRAIGRRGANQSVWAGVAGSGRRTAPGSLTTGQGAY